MILSWNLVGYADARAGCFLDLGTSFLDLYMFLGPVCILDPVFSSGARGNLTGKLPSGYLTARHGKSPFLIGKPSINVPFSMAMLNNQMVIIFGPGFFFGDCAPALRTLLKRGWGGKKERNPIVIWGRRLACIVSQWCVLN